jgi:hypothetical protein
MTSNSKEIELESDFIFTNLEARTIELFLTEGTFNVATPNSSQGK